MSKAYPMELWRFEAIMAGRPALRRDAEFVARRLQAGGTTAIVFDNPPIKDSVTGQPRQTSGVMMLLTSNPEAVARHIAAQGEYGRTNAAVFAA